MVARRSERPLRVRVAATVMLLSLASVAAPVLDLACGPGSIGDLTAGRPRDGGADVDLCPGRKLVPERPKGDDAPAIPELLFAMDDMRLDTLERDGGIPKPSGFDLDRTCDCIEPPSCVRPLDAGLLCEPDGRDNVAGSLLTDLTILLPFLQPDFLRSRIHEGVYTVLIAVRDWNGTPNDPKVGVSVRMSVGTGRDTNNLLIPPKFDGEDVWDVDSNSLADGKQYEGRLCHEVACVGPTDVSGYVANGTLVAQFPEIGVAVNTGNGLLTLPFTGATLAAQITGEGTSARLKGELVGRMVADALLTATSALRDPFTNQAVCSNPTTYGFIQSGLCGATDLAQLAADDRTGRPCRALSAVVGFTGSPAKTGVIRGTIQDPSDCPGFVGSCPSR